jgi:tetratricopeptide (TPR) repeat protein
MHHRVAAAVASVVSLLLALAPCVSKAQDADPAPSVPAVMEEPDREVARRFYEKGVDAYSAGRYDDAVSAFREALALQPSPALHFNIARSYDRLGKWGLAADEYQRYIDTSTDEPSVATARDRIVTLRARQAATAAALPKKKPVYKRGWLWGTVAGVAAGALAVGLGVGLGVHRDPVPTLGTARGD